MGWLLHLVQQGGAFVGCVLAQSAPRCTKCNSPSINGQCTNFILFDVAHCEGLILCEVDVVYSFAQGLMSCRTNQFCDIFVYTLQIRYVTVIYRVAQVD